MLNGSYQSTFVRSYESMSDGQKVELDNFIRGSIQGYLAANPKFTVADIVGGKFTNWSGTPLDYIYQYHKQRTDINNPEAIAGQDIGRIYKNVMSKDKTRKYIRLGEVQMQYPVAQYALDGRI